LKTKINFNMLVCLCHPTTDRDVDAAIDDGARTVNDLARRCGAGTGCGGCLEELRDRLASSASCARGQRSERR
jgi:bacterioferritin-associated ferredoxin